jgi:hypothetical protein
MPTMLRIAIESYSDASTAGSDRLNDCCRKEIRSIGSSPTGRRPVVPLL